jgi:hypothetical protein
MGVKIIFIQRFLKSSWRDQDISRILEVSDI